MKSLVRPNLGDYDQFGKTDRRNRRSQKKKARREAKEEIKKAA